jgi:predicted TIM-barrel fold metal-dependent hydrolase
MPPTHDSPTSSPTTGADTRYVLISADCHAGADVGMYKDYLETRWHEEFDAWASTYSSPWDEQFLSSAKRNWDSDFRLAELDADGVAAEVLFPNTVPPFFTDCSLFSLSLPRTRAEYERRWAGLRAHNRWLVDFCREAPARRRGVLQFFPNEPADAIEEIRWAKDTGVFCLALMSGIPPNFVVEPWFHPRYEPLWAASEELGMPVGTHAGSGNPDYPEDAPASGPVRLYENQFFGNRTLGHLILAGVFDRYPQLKFVQTENRSLAWAPAEIERLDALVADMADPANHTFHMYAAGSKPLELMPSDYLRRNCYHTASLDTPGNYRNRHVVGIDRVMWGADYPHEECSTPSSETALRWLLEGVPEDECQRMLSRTAAALYGFDLDELAPIAAAIGPSIADVSRPLESLGPNVRNEATATVSMAARPFTGGRELWHRGLEESADGPSSPRSTSGMMN